ncbi:Hypothetical predicted protein [Pelobates cultripes]|uniref:Transmembrane protein 154 n=1 Tax=Pelobates cultripes TaxID=61616 RepID=A0AAD1SJU5_PELCU|nr:Hypothetical predicted protein [Pelobates cultripes]CAH2301176.1 Hypothetical predicted protein [Pelobates cultripes]
MLKYLCATSFALFLLVAGEFTSTEHSTTAFIEPTAITPSGDEENEVLDPTVEYLSNESLETTTSNDNSSLHPNNISITTILLFIIPIVALLLLIPLIYYIVKRKRWRKEDEDSTRDENIKSPIFEEDTPSVMEIEMEELDKWMNNMRKNGSRLSILEEESKFQMSDNEHDDASVENDR